MRLFVVVLLFLASYIYANEETQPCYIIESLQQFPNEPDDRSLILLEEKIYITIPEIENDTSIFYHYYQFDSEYLIQNKGISCKKTIGISVLSDISNWIPSMFTDIAKSVKFLVDGKEVVYRNEFADIEYANKDTPSIKHKKAWLVIDIEFPSDKPVLVKVSYTNRFVLLRMGLYAINYGIYPNIYPYLGYNENNGFNKEIWVKSIDYSFYLFIKNKSNDKIWIHSANFYYPYKNILVNNCLFNNFEIEFIDSISILLKYNRCIQYDINIFPISIFFSTTYLDYEMSNGLIINYTQSELETPVYISKSVINPKNIYLLTLNQLKIIRNAFYAQYGYIFQDIALKNLFGYGGKFEFITNNKWRLFNDSLITNIEKMNINIIRDVENLKHGVVK